MVVSCAYPTAAGDTLEKILRAMDGIGEGIGGSDGAAVLRVTDAARANFEAVSKAWQAAVDLGRPSPKPGTV